MKSNQLIIFVLVLSSQLIYAQQPIDSRATKKTKALYDNLHRVAASGIMFGHQASTAYGVGWKEEKDRSDVKDITGAYPAVHGWDISKEETSQNIDGVVFARMHDLMIRAYKNNGINSISWHVDNPVTGGNAWDTVSAVKHILPGGTYHAAYVARLDKVADFLKSIKSGFSKVPMIFRPFHEHNGGWFWWGKGHCTEEEYIALFRFTVDYLKNEKGIHHLLYAFSPDRSRINMEDPRPGYLYGYPGDEYVDIIGYDDYMDVGIGWNSKTAEEQRKDFVAGMELITQLAAEKNKVAALTETGLEGVSREKWFTEVILDPIKNNSAIHLAYFLVWRNANTKHHYAPYPGHAAAPDFIRFYEDSYTYFESDLQNMYKKNKSLFR